MKHYGIDCIFDIGANAGQYAKHMRSYGYNDKIISFEPLHEPFQKLKKATLKDKNWTGYRYAIGNENKKSTINVAGNSYSSSILQMLPQHQKSAPQSKYIAKEEIEIKKLDSIFDSICEKDDKILLKIDTQGYEKKVLDGAIQSLHKIHMIQLEMSLTPLYENELLFVGMINHLESKGFQLYSLENGFSDPNLGRLLQVDGIFVNKTQPVNLL